MKLITLLIIITIMQASAVTRAQNVTLKLDHASLEDVFNILHKRTGYNFIYNTSMLEKAKPVNVDVNNQPFEQVLTQCLKNQSLTYVIDDKTIVISNKEELKKIVIVDITVTGIVSDSKGGPLPGVTVKVKGTQTVVATNANGNFTIKAPSGNDILVFTYVGYETHEVNIAGRTSINVQMLEKLSELKEVTVTYGKQKEREVTGSLTQIKAAGLQDMPVAQFSQQLQGKVAGVQVNQYSGQPGRGMAFRIRGAASLFANNQPLIVVDGIPINSNPSASGVAATDGISNINPAEIETFTVLKDASSTALYGSRAANGVILITTKHATAGDSKVDFSTYYGVQKINQNRLPQLMNAQEFAQFQKEIYEDKVKYENFKGTLDPVYQNPAQYGEGTNWIKTVTQSAPIQSYNLSVTSAREKSASAVIAGYYKQDGVLVNSGMERYSVRLNQDLRFAKDKIKIGFNVAPSYTRDHNTRLSTDDLEGIYEDVYEASPIIPAVNPDGSMPLFVNSPGQVSTVNPYAVMSQTDDTYKTSRVLANTYLNYEFLKGLQLKTNVAIDKTNISRNNFKPSTVDATGVASGVSASADLYSWTAEANLQYNKTFANDHNIEILAGYSAQKFGQETNTVTGTNFPSNDVRYISAAGAISAGSSNITEYSLLSTIARLNYNYKGRYLLSGAIRSDGSSRFGSNRKYGSFPSISAGWIISDEKFMEKFANKIDLLKIRASYGITGNNNIGNYTFLANTGAYNYVLNGTLVPGTTISNLANSDLAWERNKQFDIGLELNILKNRIAFTYDYYHKVSDGLIQDRPIVYASGFGTVKYNVGEFEFWGHEFTVNTTNLTGKVRWSSNFNISFDRNLIKSLVSPGFIRRNNTTSTDYYRNQVGHHIGEFYGLIWEGLFKDQADLDSHAQVKWGTWYSTVGTPKITDVSGPNGVPDGIVDENDRTFIGDPNPDFTFGFTNNFGYKNFDLNISMAGSVGGQVMNYTYLYLSNMVGSRMGLKALAERWRSPENPGNGYYPRSLTNTSNPRNQINSQLLENGSYLAAKNISLGYNFTLKNPVLQKIRAYASVQQAFIITAYRGINPEVSVGGADPTLGLGVDTNAYPVPRTFTLGVNMSFK